MEFVKSILTFFTTALKSGHAVLIAEVLKPSPSNKEKRCFKCGELKARTEFYKDRTKKDGLQTKCISCDNNHTRAWYAANKERHREKGRAWYAANIDRAKETDRAWYAANKERHNEKGRAYYAANKDRKKETMRVWYETNKESKKETAREWAKTNPDKRNAINAKRRAQKLQATPAWLTEKHKEEILSFYTKATDLTKETGTEYHVDHIVPLQGTIVCGLHVPWNLQVISGTENSRKGNRLCP